MSQQMPMANFQPAGNYPPPGPPPNYNYAPQPGQVYQANYAAPQNMPMMPPGQVVWMTRPNPVAGCPPGLEYLLQIEYLKIHQVPSLMEAFTGWDTNNKYAIYNSAGMQVYYAMEKSDTCMRACCGANRGFTIHIVDNFNTEVLKVTREFKCCGGCACCDACAHEISVETPDNRILGYVKQKCACCGPEFEILNENHEPVLKIKGPKCILDGPCCTKGNDFKVLPLTDSQVQVGNIKKEYAGFVREMYTTADNFSLSFPLDMSVNTKATLIGATFLIDFMFFETKQNGNSSNSLL